MMMADDTLFDDPDVDRPDPAARKAVRQAVLGGLVQVIRARRGWSVNDAASSAHIAPMTWRRVEDGLDVRQRTLTALDGLLGVQFGTVKRALDDDLVMVELVDLLDIGVDTDTDDVAGLLATLAERFRTGAAPRQTIANAGVAEGGGEVGTPTVRQGTGRAGITLSGRGELSVGRRKVRQIGQAVDPEVLRSLAAVSLPDPSTLTLAAQLVDRLTRLPALTEAIEHAVASILAAMPDMVTARIEDAMPAVDVLAQSGNRTLHQAAKEVAEIATDKAVEAFRHGGAEHLPERHDPEAER